MIVTTTLIAIDTKDDDHRDLEDVNNTGEPPPLEGLQWGPNKILFRSVDSLDNNDNNNNSNNNHNNNNYTGEPPSVGSKQDPVPKH